MTASYPSSARARSMSSRPSFARCPGKKPRLPTMTPNVTRRVGTGRETLGCARVAAAALALPPTLDSILWMRMTVAAKRRGRSEGCALRALRVTNTLSEVPAQGNSDDDGHARRSTLNSDAPARGPLLAVRRAGASLMRMEQIGLVAVVLVSWVGLTLAAGSHVDHATGTSVNNFLNVHTLIQMATDASGFAIMGVGATIVIVSGGIDLSVGAIYALSGVMMAMVLRAATPDGGVAAAVLGLLVCVTVSVLCGLANGVMVIGLGVHPFIITLGTMWMLRGVAFVISHAESILVPSALTAVAKAPLGLGATLYPVPLLMTLAVTIVGGFYLRRTVMGRHIFAVGGNAEAARYAGLSINRIRLGVYVLSGLTAG